MKLKLNEIQFRKDLYPRFETKQELVERYSNAIKFLPPIKTNQNNILIDGWHRWKAHKLAGEDEISVEIVKTKSEKELRKLAYKWNSNHGLQLSTQEKKEFANEMVEEMSIEELADILSVHKTTIQDWTVRKREELKKKRNRKIVELYLKAEKTQKVIGNVLDISIAVVNEVLEKKRENQTLLEKKNILFSKESLEISKSKQLTPYIYNLWGLQKADKETKHFGYFPEMFISNLFYYHTKPFDTIYDPFAGSGTIIDICKKCFRRYYCSDIKVRPGREEDIKQWKIQDGLPDEFKYIRPNLVFLDPPYWRQSRNKYSTNKDDLANMSLKDFYSSIKDFLKKITSKKPDRIAIVISPTQFPNDNHEFEDHIFKLHEMLVKYKYKIEMRYQLPYSTQQYNDVQVNIMKEEKKCISIVRDLVVWKR